MSDPNPTPEPAPSTPPPPPPAAYAPPPPSLGFAAFDPRHKNPILASILSLMPGLGQVYVGYYLRGFVHAVIVGCLLSILSSTYLGAADTLFGFFMAFFWLYNVIDAGRQASLYNQAVLGGEQMPLPVELPGRGGSIFGGAILALVGFVFLLDTAFDVSLDWIEDWWPVAPLVLGGYLIYMGIRERRTLAAESES